jgi:hypothetical protein
MVLLQTINQELKKLGPVVREPFFAAQDMKKKKGHAVCEACVRGV